MWVIQLVSWDVTAVSGRCKIICEATPCNSSLLPPLCHSVLFHFWLVLSISGACSLLDCQSYKELLCGGKKGIWYLCQKVPPKVFTFKVKVNSKKAATAHIVFAVTFWKSHSWCVLWTGLVGADSGSVWIRNLSGQISETEPEMSTGQCWYWEELPFSRITQWESRKQISFLLISDQWGFCFAFLLVFFKLSVCHRLAKAECVPLWRQSLLETGCHQQSVWPKQYSFLSFPFFSFQNNS